MNDFIQAWLSATCIPTRIIIILICKLRLKSIRQLSKLKQLYLVQGSVIASAH